jgi:thiamine pyrophosphokinase
MKRCVIFAAGPMEITALLPTQFSEEDYIIAADAGIRNAARLSVIPQLVMGDMDSLDQREVPEGAILFPVRKDDTDLMLAVKKGIELGGRDFLIYGALGGRLDHTYASIQTLSYLLDHGCTGTLVDGSQLVTLLENTTWKVPAGFRHVSIFSYTERCGGITLKGLSYPLEDALLDQNFPLGVSNSMTGEPASISVREGRLLVILSDLP